MTVCVILIYLSNQREKRPLSTGTDCIDLIHIKSFLILLFNNNNNNNNKSDAEKPFIAFNYPEVDEVTEKWADLSYLKKKIGSQTFRTETSRDNHFMYWTNGRKVSKDKNWKPPTGSISISFDEWLEEAVTNQNKSIGVCVCVLNFFFISRESSSYLFFVSF